jgi:hypothetical protein
MKTTSSVVVSRCQIFTRYACLVTIGLAAAALISSQSVFAQTEDSEFMPER